MRLTPFAVDVATKAFLARMRQEWFLRGGEGDCPVPALEDMAPRDRMTLRRSIEQAVAALDPANLERLRQAAAASESEPDDDAA